MAYKDMIKWCFCLLIFVKVVTSNEGSRECPYIPQEDTDTHPIINLGNSLKQRLLTLCKPHGRLLYKDLAKYYNQLTDVYRLLKRRDAVEIVKGHKVYDLVNKTGGPPHLQVKVDYEELQDVYNWQDSEEVGYIKEVLKLTKELWEDIEDRVTHLRSGEPEPTPVEQSTIDWTPFLREISSGSEVSHY